MKHIFYILTLILITTVSYTQVTTAENWTKTDCEGTEHTLFTELDAGNVVIMELVMLDGCVPCINAAHLMQPIIDQYNTNFENRIKWYTMGYNDTYTCEALITWKSDNEINCASQFEEGADQIEYYGGMGMPTIVIVGRNTHKVYFNEFGFVPADTVAFAEAIEYALGIAEPVSVIEEKFKNISITPNPASDFIHITDLPNSPFTLTIINASGAIIQTMEGSDRDLDVRSLPNGLYFLKVLSQESYYSTPFVKN